MSLDKSGNSPIFDEGDRTNEDELTDEQYSERKIRVRKAPEIPYLDVENSNGVFGNEVLVGHGEKTNENCGVFSRYMGCLHVHLHGLVKLDGKSYEGKIYAKMGYHYCYKPSCPKCFKHGWRSEPQKEQIIEFKKLEKSSAILNILFYQCHQKIMV